MELCPNLANHFFLRTIIYPPLGHLAGAPVNDIVPLRLSVRVHGIVKAGDKLAGQIRPILFGQGHYFGHFFGGNAHAVIISPFPAA